VVLLFVLLRFAITQNIGCQLVAHLTLKRVPFFASNKYRIAYGIFILAFL
jgi:hypothetical protein